MQLSIASEDKVFVVILFDRAARVLFGCSADEFFNFTMLNPSAGNINNQIQGSFIYFFLIGNGIYRCFVPSGKILTFVYMAIAVTAGKILEGEMFEMKLSKPKINGNAQNLRAVAVSPLCSDFVPAMETLKKLYRVGGSQP